MRQPGFGFQGLRGAWPSPALPAQEASANLLGGQGLHRRPCHNEAPSAWAKWSLSQGLNDGGDLPAERGGGGWDPGFQMPPLCSQLEWAMKLWWPHSEAMIAFLMGYSETGDPALLRIFYQVAEYTFHRVSAASWS